MSSSQRDHQKAHRGFLHILREIGQGTFFELAADWVATLLKSFVWPLVLGIVGTILTWLVGWKDITFSVPVWGLILGVMFVTLATLFIESLVRHRGVGLQGYYDVLWRFDANVKIIASALTSTLTTA